MKSFFFNILIISYLISLSVYSQKTEIGKISIKEQGLKTIHLDGIKLYRGVNTGSKHHRDGLKLHYVRFV